MSVLNNSLLLGAPAAASGGVSRSLRFNSGDSAYLSRTPASAGNQKTYTLSMWIKRSTLGAKYFFGSYFSNLSRYQYLGFNSSDQLELFGGTYTTGGSTSTNVNLSTTAVYRDVSAWYHIVLAVDTTQATNTNRVKLYVNGTQVTAFGTATYPAQNTESYINSVQAHYLGDWGGGGSLYLDGYLADIYFIDGQALDPTSFGEFDATTGVWNPKAYTGSYGTNGTHLEFADNSAATATTLGKDTSGNGNNWSVNNLSVITGGPTSVASASGALPIYNTTDTYGAVKGTGTRTDSNSSSIVLAVPMDGTNGGTTFTDESATIKGSGSAKSITRNNTVTSTSVSKFYGSSGSFNGSNTNLEVTSSLSDFSFAGNFTIECWLYLNSGAGSDRYLLDYRSAGPSGQNTYVYFNDGGSGGFKFNMAGAGEAASSSNAAPKGAWHHFALVRNGSTITAYINGNASVTQTNSSTIDAPGTSLKIGSAWTNTTQPWDGYIADFRVYSGLAKYTSSFNPPSSTQNPTIAAGNDSLVDVPSSTGTDNALGGEVRGNYCTWNPLSSGTQNFLNGNLQITRSSAAYALARGTFGLTSGKWYWEFTCVTDANEGVGVCTASHPINGTYLGATADGWAYYSAGLTSNGRKYNSGSNSTYGAAWGNGDVIGIAVDIDAQKIWFSKNGTWQESGNPATGANAAYTNLPAGGPVFPATTQYASTTDCHINFGQRAFAYTAPSGFKALCTANLPAPSVTKPSTVMDVKLYTGTGSTQSITGLGFSPDFVWIKRRTVASNHCLFDVVRGATKRLVTDGTDAEATVSTALTSFDSSGFTVGSDSDVNGSTYPIVSWAWDAGTSTVTNTQGSITSSVRANATAGFSVVTYTGNGSGTGATVGHGLGVEPSFFIIKNRSASSDWVSYHKSVGSGFFLILNSTSAAVSSAMWDGAPSSTVLKLNDNSGGTFTETNTNGQNYVAYCFAPVVGYTSMGSYVGDGSTSGFGPFINCGFRPKFVLIKSASVSYSWLMFDSVRNPYNLTTQVLYADSSTAEMTNSGTGSGGYESIDILSNGFQIKSNSARYNQSGATYIYFAVAESPFQYARAR